MTGPMFLDIETTGWSNSDQITVVGWYFQGEWRRWVNGLDAPAVLRSDWLSSGHSSVSSGDPLS